MTETPTLPRRFYSLDVLRGFAALSVVFWHWQHFFYDGTTLGAFIPTKQPFYSLLRPFYTQGGMAVDLFFCLSGFIFFWLYSQSIAERKVRVWEFGVLRFSRLYPLHFATLLIVAVGQWLMRSSQGAFFVYPKNDGYHFILQLLFASNVGLERGYSFNGPIWSVSVEILLYTIFFAACVFGLRRWWQISLLAALGFFFEMSHLNFGVGRGLSSFFMGGLSFMLFSSLVRQRVNIKPAWLIALNILMWLFIAANGQYDVLYRGFYLIFGSNHFAGRNISDSLLLVFFQLLAFPITIISLALMETSKGSFAKPVSFIGDISYSSYLLHFPLQLWVMCFALRFGMDRSLFYSPIALPLFFVVLIPLALASYHYFERPMQSLLRRRLLGRNAVRIKSEVLDKANMEHSQNRVRRVE